MQSLVKTIVSAELKTTAVCCNWRNVDIIDQEKGCFVQKRQGKDIGFHEKGQG